MFLFIISRGRGVGLCHSELGRGILRGSALGCRLRARIRGMSSFDSKTSIAIDLFSLWNCIHGFFWNGSVWRWRRVLRLPTSFWTKLFCRNLELWREHMIHFWDVLWSSCYRWVRHWFFGICCWVLWTLYFLKASHYRRWVWLYLMGCRSYEQFYRRFTWCYRFI